MALKLERGLYLDTQRFELTFHTFCTVDCRIVNKIVAV